MHNVRHRRMGTFGLGGGVIFLPGNITQRSKGGGVKSGCKRRRSSFSNDLISIGALNTDDSDAIESMLPHGVTVSLTAGVC